ncbi:MAG: transposase [Thermodesulfovibrionales bacterium]
MSRPLRIQYEGAVYHITCRGNERRDIFRDETDRKTFLDILAKSLHIYNVTLYSYALMKNHFHLLVETPRGNLGEFMRHFNITYTGYYNRIHRRAGHLYQGRYKSIVVDREEYLSKLSRYIHLNPIRIRAMKNRPDEEKAEYLKNYRWSSLTGYLSIRKKGPLVDYEMVLGEYGGDNTSGRRAYKKRIIQDIAEGLEIKDRVIGQSVLGGDEFIDWIKEKFIKGKKHRERPALRQIGRYRAREEIIKIIEKETGKSFEEIRKSRGSLRQIVMDLLYRIGGLKGAEIGGLLGVDYSTVSQGRKRLREKMERDRKMKALVNRVEKKLSI